MTPFTTNSATHGSINPQTGISRLTESCLAEGSPVFFKTCSLVMPILIFASLQTLTACFTICTDLSAQRPSTE